jgi:hypothetical protein
VGTSHKSLVMAKVQEREPLFYVMVFHMCNVKKLMVGVFFVSL